MKINTYRGIPGSPAKCFILDVKMSLGYAPDIGQLKYHA